MSAASPAVSMSASYLVNQGTIATFFSDEELFETQKADYDKYVFGPVGIPPVLRRCNPGASNPSSIRAARSTAGGHLCQRLSKEPEGLQQA